MPELIAAAILGEMVRYASDFLGGVDIKKAVITVPAYFNDA